MKLPFEEFDTIQNILPYDGEALYFPCVDFGEDSHDIYQKLKHTIEWKPDVVTIFGKTITTSRKIALFSDKKTSYTYSKQTKHTHLWIKELLPIKYIIEKLSGEVFNCCLCNLYHNGKEGMGWHRDNEKVLDSNASITSVSFGAKRFFTFKHRKTQEKVKIQLDSGSVLLMKPPTQEHWVHSLPKSEKIKMGRINLTFRNLKNI